MVMRINLHNLPAPIGSSAFTPFIEIETRANINRAHYQDVSLKLPRKLGSAGVPPAICGALACNRLWAGRNRERPKSKQARPRPGTRNPKPVTDRRSSLINPDHTASRAGV
jgi:hypothetical protein